MEMDKGQSNESSSLSCSSSSSATITNSSGSSSSSSSSRDTFLLKHVNKNSHKIAKPIRKHIPPPPTNASSSTNIPILDRNPLHPGPGPAPAPAPPQSQQPPVYNINKNDFRDVVQKLTGSPAHERFPPPVATHLRPSSSRLQRIRPPPLAQIGNLPPQLTHLLPRPQNDAGQRDAASQGQPLPPLPPLPSVHPAAESPISAYMRFLQSSTSSLWNGVAPVATRPDSLLPQNDFGLRAPPFSPLPPVESPISAYMRFLQSSARPSSAASAPPPPPPPPRQQQQQPPPSSAAFLPVLPLSPLPFGCVPSPRSPYGMMSPTGQLGLPQLPLSSPTLPVPSPRWKGV